MESLAIKRSHLLGHPPPMQLQSFTKALASLSRRTHSTFSLSNLRPAPGSTRQQNRVGRGPGSGRGKTAGRGQKGQWARASVHPWFEGGQTPITALFPKVGFRSKLAKPTYINLGRIQALIDAKRLDPSAPITMREIYKSGAVGNTQNGIKILARGALRTKIDLSATRATAAAIQQIEANGGTFSAQYYSRLGMRALTRPEATLRKFARLPMRARPMDRRNIEFYRSPEARGYLAGTEGAPQVKRPQKRQSQSVSPLAAVLDALKASPAINPSTRGFLDSGTH